MWRCHGSGEQKFVLGVWVTWPRWPPQPYTLKIFKNLLQNQRANDLGAWYAASGHGPNKVCSKDDIGLTLTFFMASSNLIPYAFIWKNIHSFRKNVRKSFNGRNLQQMTRVTKGLCLYKNFDPKGFSTPVQGLYTCLKTWKNQTSKRLFLNLQQMGKVIRPFCWHQNFVPRGLSAPALWLYTCIKSLKNVYKIRPEFFLNL